MRISGDSGDMSGCIPPISNKPSDSAGELKKGAPFADKRKRDTKIAKC